MTHPAYQRAAAGAVTRHGAGRRALQRSWTRQDDGLAVWVEDDKGNKARPPYGYSLIGALPEKDRKRLQSAYSLGDNTVGVAVHTFHMCELRGRER